MMDEKLKEELMQYYLPKEIDGLGKVLEELGEFANKSQPLEPALVKLGPRVSSGGRYKRPVLEYLIAYADRVQTNSKRFKIKVRPADLLDVLKEHYPFIGKKGHVDDLSVVGVGSRTFTGPGQKPGYGPR